MLYAKYLTMKEDESVKTILNKIRDYADNAHGSQMRKYTPERYIVHPVRVMETCKGYDADIPMLAAALLHDVLEDTPVSKSELLDFLQTVMDPVSAEDTVVLVEELTDVYVKEAYPQWNRNQRKAKELERFSKTSGKAQTIKYADIIDNSNEITRHDPAFAPRYLKECLKIVESADKGNHKLRKIAEGTIKAGLARLKER